MEPKLVGILKEAIQGELAQYFSLPAEVVPRVSVHFSINEEKVYFVHFIF